MLNRLYVKNVALISEANIEFDCGLNVLSGETGAGKSVILDSVNFVLGSKADRTMIRHGEKEALVRAEFAIDTSSAAAKKLEEYDIETDGFVIITRKLTSDGKSAIKINGNAVTVAMLKNVTQHLVDVHGQSEHFFLLNEDNQLKVLDGLIGGKALEIKDKLTEKIAEKKNYKAKISALGGNEAERARRLDLLDYQIKEIENAELKSGEFEELKARQNILLNAERIFSAINSVNSILSSDGGCGDGIVSAIHEINRISSLDEAYSDIASRLDNINTEITDIAETLSDLADNLSFDEHEAAKIDERLTLIKSLKKKYGSDEEEILAYKDKARTEYDMIFDSAAAIEKYTEKITECDDTIFTLCNELTKLRMAIAEKLSYGVEKELKTLNIPNAKFNVRFEPYNKETVNLNNANGGDKICFEFSANKGEPLKPLSKVISGGEMSRFMLAVKTILKNLNGITTYIFDEIDAGISGYTAGAVAKKFIDISKSTQIIAVSHLPQVCAASDAQFLIYKEELNGKTITRVKRLEFNDKVLEIVRLTGNVESDTAKRHAEELINNIKN